VRVVTYLMSGVCLAPPVFTIVASSVVRYPRYRDTCRRYLRDDTSIAKITIYRGIS